MMDARATSIRETVAALGLGEDVARAFIDARVPADVATRVLQPRRDAYWLLGTAIGFKAASAWLATLPRWRGYALMKRAGGTAAAQSWLRKFAQPPICQPPARPSAAPASSARSRQASVDARWAEVVEQLNRENSA
jgi:hypothetical protein